MLLTITTTHEPATDLGYLLHKNPARAHVAEMPFGQAHVFYPEATEARCTAALMLEVDPVRLVRGQVDSRDGGFFDQYVNDRPYAASSFLSSAMTEVFSTAMNGRSKERQAVADAEIPLEAEIPVLPARGGERVIRGLFEPLGYEVEATRLPLDPRFPEWGESAYFSLRLKATKRLRDLLTHLYVLIPVLDESKHYFVNRDEIDKLLLRGQAWLSTHPMRDEITKRYLRRDRLLTREALERLAEMDGVVDPDEQEATNDAQEEAVERTVSLHERRLASVVEVLKATGARSVLDLGCGEGRLLRLLMAEFQFERIVGMDVSWAALEKAQRRLKLDRMPERQAARLAFLHGSLVYRDRRLEGFEAAAVVEVIEHLDPPRLAAFERALFEFARPRTVVLTTPNREYNALFETLPAGKMRHPDHRFEWTREEFETWSRGIAERHGYRVEFQPIGPVSEQFGAPSQMAVFAV
ncbi:MAG: 3' terminal RNA ribose 2'-O-methyltransferase Hen1 [Fimbriimonas sp.]